MSGRPRWVSSVAQVLLAGGALGGAALVYAGAYERNAYRLRRVDVPVLPAGTAPIRVLHISDLHLTPYSRARQRWVSRLAALEPDLVVNTGDNLSHPDSVGFVLRTLGRLLDGPGVFVWGSNDYYAPTRSNPFRYLTERGKPARPGPDELPWQDLRRGFTEQGWIDLTHERATIEVRGVRFGFRGTDDGHLRRDHYETVAGPVDRSAVDVALGVTHAPYRRILDAMTADGLDLILAGHTHGGQVCVPGIGALVTNCDLDTDRVKGLSTYSAAGHTAWLHVSAGLGTSPYQPFRFACPPEATLLTLTAPR